MIFRFVTAGQLYGNARLFLYLIAFSPLQHILWEHVHTEHTPTQMRTGLHLFDKYMTSNIERTSLG